MEQRHIIDTAKDGLSGWELAISVSYDLVLLDVMLPKLDGIQFCHQLRDRGSHVPIMLLTNRDTSQDKTKGLNAGADDYVLKTVEWQELDARIRALLRRQAATVSTILEWGKLRLEPGSCNVSYGGQALNLTAKEFTLLELFLRNRERVYTNSAIVNQLWSLDDEPPSEDTIRSHIRRLRQKLKTVGAADLIETVYGLGYRLNQAFGEDPIVTSSSGIASNHKTPKRLSLQPKGDCRSLEMAKTVEAKIIVLDDDPFTLRLLKGVLEPWGLRVVTLRDPLELWNQLDTVAPDLLVLDIEMPNVDGIEICQTLRNDSRWSWLPVLFLTGHRDAHTIQQVFTAGADDYINKPVLAPELVTRIFNRLERTRLLRNQTENDALTNLPNRYRASQDLDNLLQRAARSQESLCLAVLILDNLKQINRQYGHRLGDAVLRHTANLLRQNLGDDDILSRWDGAEFLIGMYGLTRQDGIERLDKILTSLQLSDFSTPDGSKIRISISAGLSQYAIDGEGLQVLYQTAADVAAAIDRAGDRIGDRVLSA